MERQKKRRGKSRRLVVADGCRLLMATSAIGPGFLTQTATFTNTLAASFGFVILISIILDILPKPMYGASSRFLENAVRKLRIWCFPDWGISSPFSSCLADWLLISGISGCRAGASGVVRHYTRNRRLNQRRDCHFDFRYQGSRKSDGPLYANCGLCHDYFNGLRCGDNSSAGWTGCYTYIRPGTYQHICYCHTGGRNRRRIYHICRGHRLLDAGIKGKESIPQVTKARLSAF